MKKIAIITIVVLAMITSLSSCTSKQDPGLIYMPDMTYSRAYETYAERDSTNFTTNIFNKGGNKIFYNSIPVIGSIKRGELFPYTIANDSNGYIMSASVKNPFQGSLTAAELEESGRLYNINCGICHGEGAAGNGPLSTSGKVGGIANLTLPNYVAMADGTMYHVIEYGKGLMGSYASQLSREQRWKIIKYIRTLQAGDEPVSDSTGTGASPKDSTAVAGK